MFKVASQLSTLDSDCDPGGGERDRTDDLLLAKQALSQLSYTPQIHLMVGLDGFEPSTPALSRRCSNQLSYRPCVTETRTRNRGQIERGQEIVPWIPNITSKILLYKNNR